MPGYHFNFDTGKKGPCGPGPAGCPLTPSDGKPVPHFANKEEAARYEELWNAEKHGTTAVAPRPGKGQEALPFEQELEPREEVTTEELAKRLASYGSPRQEVLRGLQGGHYNNEQVLALVEACEQDTDVNEAVLYSRGRHVGLDARRQAMQTVWNDIANAEQVRSLGGLTKDLYLEAGPHARHSWARHTQDAATLEMAAAELRGTKDSLQREYLAVALYRNPVATEEQRQLALQSSVAVQVETKAERVHMKHLEETGKAPEWAVERKGGQSSRSYRLDKELLQEAGISTQEEVHHLVAKELGDRLYGGVYNPETGWYTGRTS